MEGIFWGEKGREKKKRIISGPNLSLAEREGKRTRNIRVEKKRILSKFHFTRDGKRKKKLTRDVAASCLAESRLKY